MGDSARPISGLRRKAVVAVLALDAGSVVSTDRLIDAVWDGNSPATALNTLQSHVSYLRRAFGAGAAIVRRPPGYLLEVAGEATDVRVAEHLIRLGRQAPNPSHRASHLRAALRLWRGRPLADVRGLGRLEGQAQRIERIRRAAVHALTDARLALGEHAELVPELADLVDRHPLDEDVHGQLMLALYRGGRQADALAVFARLRSKLRDELGIDPGMPLRELEVAILRQDTSLDLDTVAVAVGGRSPESVVPAQLPPSIGPFVGRDDELGRLDELLKAGHDQLTGPAAVVISAVSGTAGVGKTALAVRWAHRVADQFPDGQLYVNLRGFDPSGSPTDPADAICGFLYALGVPPQRIPAGLDARTALYRSLLCGRRVLVILDNARDVDQVRPLLPGAPTCVVVVTSRNQLSGLVAADGAHSLTLDLLTRDEALDLLVRRLGQARAAAEPEAVDDIIDRCAGLPLALTVAAARAATHPRFSVAALAAELRDAQSTLEALTGNDTASDVRAVLSWSYQQLSPGAARLFRLLGLHPGPDITTPAAASLAGIPAVIVRPMMAELARAHLIVEHLPGRYAFHDLLRAYAKEQTSADERHTATNRLLDHYLHTAYTAARLMTPTRDQITLTAPAPGTTPEPLADRERALAWYTAETSVLLAAVDHANSAGWDVHTWQLAWTLTDFLNGQARWHESIAAQFAALAAARRLADAPAQARAQRLLAHAFNRLERYDDAHIHLRHALDLSIRIGDHNGQANTHQLLAVVCDQQARQNEALDHVHQALDHVHQALDLFQAIGHPVGQARCLNSIGWYHGQLGDYRQALVACEQALTLHQDLDDRPGRAATWDSLGYAHLHLGHHTEAIASYEHAVDLYRDLGDHYLHGTILTHLGEAHRAAGASDAARGAWQHALTVLSELDHTDADQVRTKLAALEDG